MGQWLVLDIGNTHTVGGLVERPLAAGCDSDFKSAKPSPQSSIQSHLPTHMGRLLHRARFRTDAQATVDEYRASLQQLFSPWTLEEVERIVVSSVVPPLDEVVKHLRLPSNPSCLAISASSRREFELDLPFPNQLGADRLANVAGALLLAKPPFLILDAGTATTFCLIDDRPAYVGGNIIPGLEVSWRALQSRAAKLYAVELKRPDSVIGKTTETQIQSGVLQGYEAMIEGMADRLLADWKQDFEKGDKVFKELTLFATGGCLQLLRLSPRFQMEPDLTLLGLMHYGLLNSQSQ